MPRPIHDACNDWFDKQFQTRFRSCALFGTGDLEQARKYLGEGSVLLKIWPIGSYRICYSPDVYDLFDSLLPIFSGQQPSSKMISETLDQLGYRIFDNYGLEEAASSGCEVMLVADTFRYEIQEGIV